MGLIPVPITGSSNTMTDGKFSLEAYLERIGYFQKPDTSEETLKDLHMAHTMSVPFENLDVFYKKPVLLDEASLFEKIVNKRRGGYCFEMNGIFSIALKKIGFRVTDLLARVNIDGINFTAKTHQALMVEAGGKNWLADVGFGNDGILAPLLLEKDMEHVQFAHTYRITGHPEFGLELQKKAGEAWNRLYVFKRDKCRPEDFIMSNHFTSTFPESFFIMMRMCTMPTKEGRITLTDKEFKITENGNVSIKPINGDDEFNALLKEYFKIDPDSAR